MEYFIYSDTESYSDSDIQFGGDANEGIREIESVIDQLIKGYANKAGMADLLNKIILPNIRGVYKFFEYVKPDGSQDQSIINTIGKLPNVDRETPEKVLNHYFEKIIIL